MEFRRLINEMVSACSDPVNQCTSNRYFAVRYFLIDHDVVRAKLEQVGLHALCNKSNKAKRISCRIQARLLLRNQPIVQISSVVIYLLIQIGQSILLRLIPVTTAPKWCFPQSLTAFLFTTMYVGQLQNLRLTLRPFCLLLALPIPSNAAALL